MNDNLLIELIGDLQTRIDEQDHKLDRLIVQLTDVVIHMTHMLEQLERYLTPQ